MPGLIKANREAVYNGKQAAKLNLDAKDKQIVNRFRHSYLDVMIKEN
jgi:hypothetical protein